MLGEVNRSRIDFDRRSRELCAMTEEFPELASIALEPTEDNIDSIFKAYEAIIPSLHEPAREVQFRNVLWDLANTAEFVDIKDRIERMIAQSPIRSGIIFSAHVRKFGDLWNEVQADLAVHEDKYGAPVFTRKWVSYSRGNALKYYFSHHRNTLGKKLILHVGPEPELSEWFRAEADSLQANYKTLNIWGDVDYNEDLTHLNIEDEAFDMVICHRVLEHIFDDKRAIEEALSILRPGGIFNVSVPESMHMENSNDWGIPDRTHHYHYRQYGTDFQRVLDEIGFETSVVTWMLDRPIDELNQAAVYPLRMYNARKPQ